MSVNLTPPDVEICDGEDISSQQEAAIKSIRAALLHEVDEVIGLDNIRKRNKKIPEENIIDYYIKYLKKIGDPRYEYIFEMLSEEVHTEIVDNELEHFYDLTQRFRELLKSENENKPIGDSVDGLYTPTASSLLGAVEKFDNKEALVLLSQFDRPIVENILLTAVGVNVALMIGHNLESTEQLAQHLYSTLSIGNLSGKSMVSLSVIFPFLYEAIVKMRSQGIVNYLKNNKLDTFLNIAGVAEMGFMGFELAGQTSEHAALGSLLRSLRILRIFRITQKSQVMKDVTESLGESLPSMMKVAFTFWGFSILTTLFFMEIYSHHIPEFSGISNSFDSMTRLFFSDDAVGLNAKMRAVDEVHPVTNEIAIWWARTYGFISNIFMIGIPPAIVYDVLAKNTTTKRYLASISDGLQGIKNSLGELVETVKEMRKEQKEMRRIVRGDITRLKNSIHPKQD